MRATLLVVSAVAAFVSGNAAAQTTALTHATVIDGTGAAPQRNITIVMENGRIREMAPGQFVACHFPLAPGETLATRNGQMPAGA